jgi:hypothetical protein
VVGRWLSLPFLHRSTGAYWKEKITMANMKPIRRAPGEHARAANKKMGGDLSHNVTESPHRPVKGARTKTDREPMSTSDYHGHIRRM